MKPDWDSLGSTFADSKTVVIADVDCTAAGKPLCDKYGVRGYPTIKYFNPPDEDGEDYKGGRDLAALKKFVETELGPGCSADTKENCSAEQLKDLEKYMSMDATERETQLTSLKDALKKAEDDHNDLLKNLQEQFKTSQDALEKLKEDSAPTIKMLKAATPSGKAARRQGRGLELCGIVLSGEWDGFGVDRDLLAFCGPGRPEASALYGQVCREQPRRRRRHIGTSARRLFSGLP